MELRRRDDRGAEGAEWVRSGEGVSPLPSGYAPPQKIFQISFLKWRVLMHSGHFFSESLWPTRACTKSLSVSRNEELSLLKHLDPDLTEVPVEVIPNNSDRFLGFSIIYGLVVGNLGGSLQPGKEKFMILRIVFRIPTAATGCITTHYTCTTKDSPQTQSPRQFSSEMRCQST